MELWKDKNGNDFLFEYFIVILLDIFALKYNVYYLYQ